MIDSLDNIKNIDNYQDEVDSVFKITNDQLNFLEKTILTGGDDEEKILLSLQNNFDLRKKVGFLISYDQESHLLVGDGGFGILRFNKKNGSIDMDNSLWITDKIKSDIYKNILNILGDNYNSFSVFDGNRIFSDIGNVKIDLKTGNLIFSSNNVKKYSDKLNSLGIKDHGVFYDEEFLKSIISNRLKIESILDMINDGGSDEEIKTYIDKLLGGKPIVLSIIPSENKNLASKYNNLDVLNDDYNVLYYQIANEQEFKDVLDQIMILVKYGLKIDNFYWEEHADKNHIFFANSGRGDGDMLSYTDDEFINYSDIFQNTNIVMNTCLAGKKGGKKRNITDFLASGLFLKANKIVAPGKEVYGLFRSDDDNGYTFDSFVFYGQNEKSQEGIHKKLSKDDIYILFPNNSSK